MREGSARRKNEIEGLSMVGYSIVGLSMVGKERAGRYKQKSL